VSAPNLALPPERVRTFATRDAWLAARSGEDFTIGASEVSKILGVDPHAGPWDIWTAKMQGAAPIEENILDEADDDPESERDPADPLERGQRWEAHIRAELATYLRRPVIEPGAPFGQAGALVIVRHPSVPWAQSSPDSWVIDEEHTVSGELKSDAGRKGYTWGPSGTEIVDYDNGGELLLAPHRATQLFWQIETIGLPYAYIGVLLGSYRFRWLRLRAHPDTQRQLVDEVGEWREKHLVRGIEPNPDESEACAQHYRAKWHGQKAGERAATAEEAELIRAYRDGKVQEDLGAGKKAAARGPLLKTIGDASHLYIPKEPHGIRRNKAGALSVY
jgi:hypothetical protein